MNNEDILKSDLLDIVFDKRNKNYGAYELRKHYKRRLIKALVVAFVFAGGIAALTSFIKEEKLLVSVFEIPDNETAALPPVEDVKKPEKPKQPETPKAQEPAIASKPTAQQQFSNIEITNDPLQASKINTLDESKAIGGENIEGPTSTVIVPPPTKIDAGGNDIEAPKVDKETPRAVADVMPSYPGGMTALKKFLEKNLKSFDDIEEGKVISVKITFIVGYDGKLKGFTVLEDGGTVYNNEVIRVLKKMPEWIPGKAHGENVSVYYTIPVKFMAVE